MGDGVVIPFPGFVVVVDDVVIVVGGRVVVVVVEVEVEILVDVAIDVVVDVAEELGAGSPVTSTQYDFPTSTAQVATREGFC